MLIPHVGGSHLFYRQGPVEVKNPFRRSIKLCLGHLESGGFGKIFRLKSRVTPVVPLFLGGGHHGPHPVTEGQRIVKHVSYDTPFSHLSLVPVHGGVIGHVVVGIGASPDLSGDLFLELDGKTALYKVLVGMTLGIPVEHGGDNSPHLSVGLVTVVYRIPYLGPELVLLVGPVLFAQVPPLGDGGGAVTQVTQLAHLVGDTGIEVEEEGGITLFHQVPGDAVVLGGGDDPLQDALVVGVSQVPADLSVVTPDTVVIRQLGAQGASDDGGIFLGFPFHIYTLDHDPRG